MYVSVGSCTVRVGGRTPEGTCKPGSSSSSACLLPSFGGSVSGLSTSLPNPLLSPQLDYSATFHLSASDPVCPFLKALRIKVKFQPGTQDPVLSSTDLHSQPHHPLLQPKTLAPTILDNLPCQGHIRCSHSLPQFFYRSLAS